MRGKLNEQLFPRQVVIQLPKLKNRRTKVYKYGQQEQVTTTEVPTWNDQY